MKSNALSMRMFFRQIRGDSMLYMMCFLPLLIASLFRFGIPLLEAQLTSVFQSDAVLTGYYLLFDLFLAVFAPYFLVFISAMVMLSEIDEHVAAYLAVTPVRRKGYIISRLCVPSAAFGLRIRGIAHALRTDRLDDLERFAGQPVIGHALRACGDAGRNLLAQPRGGHGAGEAFGASAVRASGSVFPDERPAVFVCLAALVLDRKSVSVRQLSGRAACRAAVGGMDMAAVQAV